LDGETASPCMFQRASRGLYRRNVKETSAESVNSGRQGGEFRALLHLTDVDTGGVERLPALTLHPLRGYPALPKTGRGVPGKVSLHVSRLLMLGEEAGGEPDV